MNIFRQKVEATTLQYERVVCAVVLEVDTTKAWRVIKVAHRKKFGHSALQNLNIFPIIWLSQIRLTTIVSLATIIVSSLVSARKPTGLSRELTVLPQ